MTLYKAQVDLIRANLRQHAGSGTGRVVFEMIESATLSKPYPLPDGTVIEPNFQSYTDRVCTWVEVGDDGLIAEIRAYIPSTRGQLMADAAA